jgi:hypothetical protein
MEAILMKARLLFRAEMVLVRLHLRRAGHQATLIATGIVAILLAIAMANVAAYFFLANRVGPALAGLILAGVNGLVAAAMFLMANRLGLGPEAQMAEEIRDLAVDQLSVEAQRIEGYIDTVKSDVSQMSTVINSLRHGDIFGLSTLVPIIKMLTRALGGKKEAS